MAPDFLQIPDARLHGALQRPESAGDSPARRAGQGRVQQGRVAGQENQNPQKGKPCS